MTELVDPSVYRVSFFIRRIRAHQVVQLFHACTESAALIDVERHQNLIPRLHQGADGQVDGLAAADGDQDVFLFIV